MLHAVSGPTKVEDAPFLDILYAPSLPLRYTLLKQTSVESFHKHSHTSLEEIRVESRVLKAAWLCEIRICLSRIVNPRFIQANIADISGLKTVQ